MVECAFCGKEDPWFWMLYEDDLWLWDDFYCKHCWKNNISFIAKKKKEFLDKKDKSKWPSLYNAFEKIYLKSKDQESIFNERYCHNCQKVISKTDLVCKECGETIIEFDKNYIAEEYLRDRYHGWKRDDNTNKEEIRMKICKIEREEKREMEIDKEEQRMRYTEALWSTFYIRIMEIVWLCIISYIIFGWVRSIVWALVVYFLGFIYVRKNIIPKKITLYNKR